MSLTDLPPIAQATAGCVGSITSNTILYPLDLITTRIQTQGSETKRGYKSPFKALRVILETDGIEGLYRGLGSDTISTGLSNFLYFYYYSFLREFFLSRKPSSHSPTSGPSINNGPKSPPTTTTKSHHPTATLSAAQEILIGSLAGMLARFWTTPLGNVTVRKQTYNGGGGIKGKAKKQESGEGEKNENDRKKEGDNSDEDADERYGRGPSAKEIMMDIWNEQGFTGFWSGYASTCLLTLNPSLTFYFFDLLSIFIIPKKFKDKGGNLKPWQTFFVSSIASMSATTITYPLILSKTHLQYKSSSGKRIYKSIFDFFLKTLRSKEGFGGFYRGLGSQLGKGFFSLGITMVIKQRIEFLIIFLYRVFVLNRRRRH